MSAYHRDATWVAAEIRAMNRGHAPWSARFAVPAERIEAVSSAFVVARASRTHIDTSTQLVVEFNPILTERIARIAVAEGATLCERDFNERPRVSRQLR